MKRHTSHTSPGPQEAAAGAPEEARTEAPACASPESSAVPPQPETPAEAAALKDRLLRLQADFENFRKRTARERQELAVRTTADLMTDLLPVLDHFELGLHNAGKTEAAAPLRSGFQLVYDQLLGVLRKYGLTPLDAAASAFDPHLHEAVAHVPSDEYPTDAIVEQVRRGYRLGERLLRPVHVVVSSGPGAPRDDEPPEPAPPAPAEV
jgi:molecular chaperone GrpE